MALFSQWSLAAPVAGQDRLHLAESEVKAGLIYSFLRYTRWPSAARAGFIVCVWSRDTLDGRLTPITLRTVDHQPIVLRIVSRASELASCSLVYIGADESRTWPLVRTSLALQGVLTVSDAAGFARAGGMIELYTANSRIGIRVNRAAVADAGLVLEDRLLRLAEPTEGPPS